MPDGTARDDEPDGGDTVRERGQQYLWRDLVDLARHGQGGNRQPVDLRPAGSLENAGERGTRSGRRVRDEKETRPEMTVRRSAVRKGDSAFPEGCANAQYA